MNFYSNAIYVWFLIWIKMNKKYDKIAFETIFLQLYFKNTWWWKLIDDKVIKLFSEKNLVFIATIMKDGSPQLSPVWANYEDEFILVNTAEGRIKHKNILRDPRVAVSVVSNDNPLDMTTIRGTVVEIISDSEYYHADKLTEQYMGRKHYPFKQDNEKRIILKIKPHKVFVLPELKMNNWYTPVIYYISKFEFRNIVNQVI